MNLVAKISKMISTAIFASRFTKAPMTMPTWTGWSGFNVKSAINGTTLATIATSGKTPITTSASSAEKKSDLNFPATYKLRQA